jgi:L-aminopeptidase/D-esterase-like protein
MRASFSRRPHFVIACAALCLAALVTTARASAPASGPYEQVLRFDFPGMRIGTAENEAGPTGATLFHFPKPVMTAVDVRGGAPGSINSDALRLSYDEPFVDAITFAGGSSYGLSVATGVAEALKEQRTDPGALANIATVAGAIIFDLGPRRFTTVTPDGALGRRALAAAREGMFPLGAAGAGRFATQGGYFDARTNSGQGAAMRQVGPTRVAVFTVVNALGHVVDRQGRVVRCAGPTPNSCGTIHERIARKLERHGPISAAAPRGLSGNTTLTLVVTNQKLAVWALQRLAVQVHSALGRAIQPYSTTNDGDVLFAATTGEVENPTLPVEDLGLMASEAAWDAVLSSVPALDARPAPGPAPTAEQLRRYAGAYEFAPGMPLAVTVQNGQLSAAGPNRANLYLPSDTPVALTAINATDFAIPGSRGDWLRFDREGVTINPGKWPVRARRISGGR